MLSKSDMNAVIKAVYEKEGNYVSGRITKESKEADKYLPEIKAFLGKNLKDKTCKDKSFLFAACEVTGLFKKKISYAMLYSKDTFYYCESKYLDNCVAVKYEDIDYINYESVDLTIIRKDKSKEKITSFRADSIYDFLNTILSKYYSDEALAKAIGEIKKVEKEKSKPEPKAEPKPVAKEAPKAKTAPSSPKVNPEVELIIKLDSVKVEPQAKAEKKPDLSIVENLIVDIKNSRGFATYSYRYLTIEQDTKLRNKCRDLDMIYKVYKSSMVKDALSQTSTAFMTTKVADIGPFACIIFNDIKGIIELIKFMNKLNINNLINIVFDDKEITVDGLLQYDKKLKSDKFSQEMGFDSDETLNVIVLKNLYAADKTSEDEFSGKIFDRFEGKFKSLNGKLPCTVISDASLIDSVNVANDYMTAGYQVDIVDDEGNPVWDKLGIIRTKIIDVNEFNTKAQILYLNKKVNEGGPFSVCVDKIGAKEVELIRIIKNTLSMDLSDAKNLVDNYPFVIEVFDDITKARELADILKATGAEISIDGEINDSDIKDDELIIRPTVDLRLISANGEDKAIGYLCNRYLGEPEANVDSLVRSAPSIINRGLSIQQGERLRDRILETGGEAEIVFSGVRILNGFVRLTDSYEILNENQPLEPEDNEIVDLWLDDFGNEKMGVIKVTREALDMGLKEAKEIVEKAPVILKSYITSAEANEIIKMYETTSAVLSKKKG